jgi:hypothetical protein
MFSNFCFFYVFLCCICFVVRAARFGLPAPSTTASLTETDKKRSRADRFGLPQDEQNSNKSSKVDQNSTPSSSSAKPLDVAALKARAERFGIEPSKVVINAEKKEQNTAAKQAEEAKKAARLARFATGEANTTVGTVKLTGSTTTPATNA